MGRTACVDGDFGVGLNAVVDVGAEGDFGS